MFLDVYGHSSFVTAVRPTVLRADGVRAVVAAHHRGRGDGEGERQNVRKDGRHELRLPVTPKTADAEPKIVSTFGLNQTLTGANVIKLFVTVSYAFS
jgi:hypothetical protein